MTLEQFTITVAKHKYAMHNFALKFTKDIDDANDLMQDTLVKAVKHFSQFEENSDLKNWLFTVMKNTFINSYHKNARTSGIITQAETVTYSHLSYSAISNRAEGNFVMGDIKGALATMAELYSVPFLRYVEGYKYNEIADELNIPIGTVKTRIHEARRQLSNKLNIYKERIN